MTRDRVDAILKGYRFDVGRCGHLAQEIQLANEKLNRLLSDEVTAMISPKPQQITDMPRGTAIGNPTEKFGLMLASGYSTEESKSLEIKIAAMDDEYKERRSRVVFVESWLSGLTERERWMVETQVIDGTFWKDVGVQYAQRFGENVSKDTLKRLRDKAMAKIYDMAR